MSTTERHSQGTSIRETWGPAVTIEDIETILVRAGAASGVRMRVLDAVRKHVSWELNKRIRPWGDSAPTGLSRVQREERDARRARIAASLEDVALEVPADAPGTASEAISVPDPTASTPPPSQTLPGAPRAAEPEPRIQIPLPADPEPLPDAEPEMAELEEIDAEPEPDDGDADDEAVVEAIRELLGVTPDLRLVPDQAPAPEMPSESPPAAPGPSETPGPIPEVPPALPTPPAPADEASRPSPGKAEPEPAAAELTELTCRACGTVKPLADFRLDEGRWPRRTCRACEVTQRKERKERERLRKTTRACSKCGVPKPLTDFRLDKSGPDGRARQCAACIRERERAWQEQRQKARLLETGFVACTKCGELKDPQTDFYPRRLKKDGRATQCKDCEKAYARNHRKPRKAAEES
jgi:hypothetical protein